MIIRKPVRAFVLLMALSMASHPDAVVGQQQSLKLDASFPEAFGFVGGIRPLPDGRVMVADPLGQLLVLADLDAGTSESFGRLGQGPQEFRQPDAVFAMPADSTLLVDLGNGRVTVIAPDGTFGRTMPLAQQSADGRLTIVIPRFIDGQGRFYYQPEDITAGPGADSALVVRFDPRESSADTVAAIRLADVARRRPGASMMLGRRPLGARDDWAVAPDGSVAVVRADGYRVEWIGPDGRRVLGPTTPIRTGRIGPAEREAWFEHFLTGQISTGIRRSVDGRRDVTFSRGTRARVPDDIDAYDWPERLPPFRIGRTVVSPEGDLWVERHGLEGSLPIVDIFNRSAEHVGEIELPSGRRVEGFGPGVVYLVRTDEYGLQWLERYLR